MRTLLIADVHANLAALQVSTVVAGGPVAAAHAVFVDGRRTEIGVGELAQTITTPANATGIRRVEVQLPSFRFARRRACRCPRYWNAGRSRRARHGRSVATSGSV